jgi:hypothetical protein
MPLFFGPDFHASIPVAGAETEIVSGEYLLTRYEQTHVT